MSRERMAPNPMQMTRRAALAGAVLGAAGAAGGVMHAAEVRAAPAAHAGDIDGLVTNFMHAFEVPGMAVAIVAPGMPAYAKGYGVRSLGSAAPVDASTLFAIASNSKAFTAAALALLVDEGRIGWEDPVVHHMPDFAMYDPVVTQALTVRDLLVHRSGLGVGAGDLMLYPNTTHTRAEIVRGLRHLKLAQGFRAGYAYDNVLYVVAGALVEAVTGKSWEAFVAERLFAPLGMAGTVPARALLCSENVAGRHARIDGPLRGMGPLRAVLPEETMASAPCGGINSSARDLVPWLQVQLAGGQLPDGAQLWSRSQADEMWTPQVIIRSSPGGAEDDPRQPLFYTYALGWGVQDYHGEQLVWHSGGLAGQVTLTAFLPARGIGFAILTNAEEPGSLLGLRNALLDRFIGAPAVDWIAYWRRKVGTEQAKALAKAKAGLPAKGAGGPSQPLERYAGIYRDPWYGDIRVGHEKGALSIAFSRTPALTGRLEPWGADVFRTHFADRTVEQALVMFEFAGEGRPAQITMRALSPIADFSYDYHDLLFQPL